MNVEIKKGVNAINNLGRRVGSAVGEKRKRITGVPGDIRVGGEVFTLRTTHDFDVKDPWTAGYRDFLIAAADTFSDKPLYEFGSGDLRNPFAITKALKQKDLPPPTHVVGIEVDGWRNRLARRNIRGIKSETPVDLVKADASKWVIDALQQDGTLTGNALLCLPQAPLGEKEENTRRRFTLSRADTYSVDDLPDYAKEWDYYGLGLNSAVLTGLSAVVDQDFRAFTMFSGRIPKDKLTAMLNKAGWDVADLHPLGMAQQDPDTPVAYTEKFDAFATTGDPSDALFYERVGETDNYNPITAAEAERRREKSMATGQGRESLNVYHTLLVAELTQQVAERELQQEAYASS